MTTEIATHDGQRIQLDEAAVDARPGHHRRQLREHVRW